MWGLILQSIVGPVVVKIVELIAARLSEDHQQRIGAALQRGADAQQANAEAADMRQTETATNAKTSPQIRDDLAQRSGLPSGGADPRPVQPGNGSKPGR